MLISIVINNYNYGRYIRDAIDSALAQTCRDIEVIVVDDGSTDDSRSIIASYGSAITVVLKENGGQGSAYNAGFAAAKGDFVLFLDSDDALFPDAAAVLVDAARVGVSKLQFPLAVADADLQPAGDQMPTITMLEGDVRESVLTYGAYGSPPASGNCYSRAFLEKALPLNARDWRICADTCLILQAPFHGSIVTIRRPLAWYRQHRPTDASGLAGNAYGLAKLLKLLDQEEELIAQMSRANGGGDRGPVGARNPAYTKNLLCAKLLDQAPAGAPSRAALAWRGFKSSLLFPMYPPRKRLVSAAWFLWAGLAPRQQALASVRLALDPSARRPARPAAQPKEGVHPA